MTVAPRIALIHALRDSLVPIWDAFSSSWPDARTFNLLDDSLSADLAQEGELTDSIVERFLTLGRYAANAGARGEKTDAILFTCSAFGPAIAAVKKDLNIPVLSPNEEAFEEALNIGGKVGLIVTFPPSESALATELEDSAATQGHELNLVTTVADGALAALQSGDETTHDELIAEAAAKMGEVSCVVLGQFSMARAAPEVKKRVGIPVITTPVAAVSRLRSMFGI